MIFNDNVILSHIILKSFVCVHFRVIIKIPEALRQVKKRHFKEKIWTGGPYV